MYIKRLVKKQLRITIITVVLVALLVVGSSYALFETTVSNPTDQTLSVGDLSITFNGGSAINISSLDPYTDAVALTKSDNIYTFSVQNTGTVAYTYTIKLEDNPAYLSGGASYSASMTLLNHNYIRYSLDSSAAASLGSVNNLIYSGTINPGKTKSFSLRLWVADPTTYNLPNEALGSEIHLNINVDGKASATVIAKPGIAADSIKNIANTSNESGGIKSISQAATTQLRATTEYRYYGANPNNYVTFNGELWRIIGVFETENESGTLEYRVKLIRNEPIGSYSWDTSASTVNSGSGINEWSQADLMKLLNPGYESNQDLNNSGTTITVNNSLYWTKGSGTCYNGLLNATTTCDFTSTGLGTEAKSMIDKAKFYTAGWNSSNITSNQFYTYERGSALVTSPSDGVTRTTSWIGYIGLMYISDYGYATDESLCANTEILGYNSSSGYYGNTACHTNDWLWKSGSYQWSIVPYSSSSYSVLDVLDSGNANLSNGTGYFAVGPVLYLKSNVQITGGEGSSTN